MPFEGAVSDRPQGPAGYSWDVDLGRSYKALADSMAWRHAMGNLRKVREMYVQALVQGKDGAAEYRKAIQVIDAFLALPAKMIADGDSSAQILRQIGRSEE